MDRFPARLPGVLLVAAALAGAWGCRTASPSRRDSVTIPLEPYLRAQTVVHAAFNGVAGTFLFDTGEGVTSISPAFAEKIGCKPWGRVTGFRMSGERLNTAHCDDVPVSVGGVALHAPVVITLDIMALLGPDVPPVDGAIGLDLFAGRIVTIVPRHALILETPRSLAARILHARELPIRIVRDAEGAAFSVDAGVRTPAGTAWMELDGGNGGSIVVANHVAPLLGFATDVSTPFSGSFDLANGIPVEGMIRTRNLIMDGNVGAQFLNRWILTLDLRRGRAWLAPVPG